MYNFQESHKETNSKKYPLSGQIPNFSSRMQQKGQEFYETDQYLAELLDVVKVRSLAVGVGGAGNNSISRLQETNLSEMETLSINTDANDLYYSNADKKLLIGKEMCNGLGSGNDPTIGKKAARKDSERIGNALDAEVVFLTCGLGGGTGTGAAPIVAREAKKNGSIVVSFCTIPFRSEGPTRRQRAKKGLKNLIKYSDTLIPIPNDNLLSIIPNAPLLTCFKVLDEVIVRSLEEVMSLIHKCGVVNIDYADIRKVLKKKRTLPSGLIGVTETLGDEKDLKYKAKLAVNNPLLKPNIQEIDDCVVSITGNHEMQLSKINRIVSTISEVIPGSSQLKFGTSIDPTIGSKIRITFLANGVVSPYVKSLKNELE
ncbi:MAG: cell division protein FtsZ [Promethearchaeia archaeon]